ncbi:hypothetical protein BK124_00525 [Paenibacillus amylolyticus]|uniref:hypothetical protein n=1 Tax=Paenibacillus amylolyticus TaxID=1451 RepID=UPI00096FCDAF|nr:hypothetical protein [Paenibacillus amylolyticus]OMF01197.1 hypothetical protein BK124_00525 [Paenibacillus amylolyticus]
MSYFKMLNKAIDKKKFSLNQICFQLAKRDIWLDRAILSKMKNGKVPPAKDELNKALAEILDLDPNEFRVAAIKETITDDLFELIRSAK